MGGSVAANLNDAQRQGGCRLPSGSGSSSGAASNGDSIGTAIGAAIGKELGKAIFGDPAEKARKDAAAREQAPAQQRAAKEAAAEMERKKQESFTRLRGALKLENFDGDSGDLLLKGVDVESDGDLGLKLGDSGGDLALKADEGDANSPAPTADPMLVDARNVPSGLPKALDDAIASAFPDVPPYKALAEDAFKRKDFTAALDAYVKALEIYPTWPEGQYNAALLAAESEEYDAAVQHMQRYLVLAAKAKDASAAKDKLLFWQLKGKQ